MKLKLTRPLIFLDLETTGTSVETDRIVEICLIKVYPDGRDEEGVWRVNPGRHIPEEASHVHGIYDADVADKPTFKQLAPTIMQWIEGCDLAGYNSNRFDVPLLVQELLRAGVRYNVENVSMIDVQNIFYKKEPRTLSAALKFYLGQDLKDAHTSAADTRATYNVLMAQLDRYADDPEVKNDVQALADYTRMSRNVDLAGKFVRNEQGSIVFNFGQHKGKPVSEVLRQNPGYYNWFMEKDFAQNSKDVLARIYFSEK